MIERRGQAAQEAGPVVERRGQAAREAGPVAEEVGRLPSISLQRSYKIIARVQKDIIFNLNFNGKERLCF